MRHPPRRNRLRISRSMSCPICGPVPLVGLLSWNRARIESCVSLFCWRSLATRFFFSDFLVTIVVAQTAGRIVTFLNRHGPPHQIDAKLLSPCFPLRFRSAKNLRPEIADNAVAEVTSRLFPFQDSLMVSIFSPFFHSFEFYQISWVDKGRYWLFLISKILFSMATGVSNSRRFCRLQ